MAYPPRPDPFFSIPAVLTDFHDHLFGNVPSYVPILFTIRQICPSISPLVLLGWIPVLLPVNMVHFYQCACCICTILDFTVLEFINIPSKCPVPFLNLFHDILIHHYRCPAYVYHVLHDPSAHLWYTENVGPPIVISAVCLFKYSVNPWSTIFSLYGYCRKFSLGKCHYPLHIYLDVLLEPHHVHHQH